MAATHCGTGHSHGLGRSSEGHSYEHVHSPALEEKVEGGKENST